jgi:hypothetical protein
MVPQTLTFLPSLLGTCIDFRLQDMLDVCTYPCEVVGFAKEDFADPDITVSIYHL